MIAGAYDQDRLPWLNGSPDETGASQRKARAGFSRSVVVVALMILIAPVAAIAIGVLTFDNGSQPQLVRRPGPLSANDCRGKCEERVRSSPKPAAALGAKTVIRHVRGSKPPERSPPVARHAPRPAAELQLGAYMRCADAKRGWHHMRDQFPRVRDYPRFIAAPAGHDDRFFRLRLRVGTADQARALCAQIKRGGGDCFVVRADEMSSELRPRRAE